MNIILFCRSIYRLFNVMRHAIYRMIIVQQCNAMRTFEKICNKFSTDVIKIIHVYTDWRKNSLMKFVFYYTKRFIYVLIPFPIYSSKIFKCTSVSFALIIIISPNPVLHLSILKCTAVPYTLIMYIHLCVSQSHYPLF